MIMALLSRRPDDEHWLKSQSITSLVKTLRETACLQSPGTCCMLASFDSSLFELARAFHVMLEAAYMYWNEVWHAPYLIARWITSINANMDELRHA